MKSLSNKKAWAAALAVAVAAGAPALWLIGAEPPTGAQATRDSRDGEGPTQGQRQKQGQGQGQDQAGDARAKNRRGDWVGPYGGVTGPFGPVWSGRFDPRPPTPGEWAEVVAFMTKYSPWRIGEVQKMPEGEWKERIKRGLVNRYRGLRALENRDPEGYEQRVAQLGVEDQVFKVVSGWRGADETRREAIKEELRTQVARLVDLDLQERRRRTQRLEDELKKQKEALERDTAGRDGLVERRVNGFLEWGNRWPAKVRAKSKPKTEANGSPDADKPEPSPEKDGQ